MFLTDRLIETRKQRWTSTITTLGVLLVAFSASLDAQNHYDRFANARSRSAYYRSGQFMTGRLRYYSPEFYRWAYSPWGAHSRGYFRPFPVYTSTALWLTDYLLAETLQKGAITPFVKQAIANEIRRQLADAGLSGVARMLSDNIAHVFVVASDLIVISRGLECTLNAGDVLQLHGPQAPGASDARLRVLASKGQSCGQGSVVPVPIQDLQEMHNHMRATLYRGLVELRSRRGGLPAPLQAPPVEADKAEQDAVSQALAPADTVTPVPAAAEKAATISIGQTNGQVVAILAAPLHIAELGDKQLYIYSNLKITFVGGKVSDVQ